MRVLKRMLLILFIIAIAFYGFFATNTGKSVLENHLKVTDTEFYDFKAAERTNKPNDVLVYKKEVNGRKLLKVIQNTPDMELIKQNGNQYEFVIRTPFMRFPDRISLLIEDENFIIYSRSLYGHSDLGANKKRVDHWLSQLAISTN